MIKQTIICADTKEKVEFFSEIFETLGLEKYFEYAIHPVDFSIYVREKVDSSKIEFDKAELVDAINKATINAIWVARERERGLND